MTWVLFIPLIRKLLWPVLAFLTSSELHFKIILDTLTFFCIKHSDIFTQPILQIDALASLKEVREKNWFNKVISLTVGVWHDICFQNLYVSLCFKRRESYPLIFFIKVKDGKYIIRRLFSLLPFGINMRYLQLKQQALESDKIHPFMHTFVKREKQINCFWVRFLGQLQVVLEMAARDQFWSHS